MNKENKTQEGKDNNSQSTKEEAKIKWLRSKDVRKMLGVGDSTLQSFRIKNLIPAYKLGDMWFYREDEINEVLLNGGICKNEGYGL